MNGARALVVALLLCVAPLGGIVTADGTGALQQTADESGLSMRVVTADNTSGYLAPHPDSIDRTDDQQTGIDVAATLEAHGNHLESAYLGSALEARYADAETDAERRAVLEEGIDQLEGTVEEYRATETRAIRRYNDGEITMWELVRRLMIVTQGAASTAETIEWLEDEADDLGADNVADRAGTAQVRLVSMDGPVRTQLGTAMAGGTSHRVYVETADAGIVLATVDRTSGTYLREAHDPSAKTDQVGDQYGGNPSPALARFTELYPWAIESFDGIDAIGPEQVRLYRFGATHPHGTLETYLDSGSTEILYERQRIDPDGMPTDTAEQTANGLRLVVNTTRAGGPLGVAVVDSTTQNPVDATIEVNGTPIGATEGGRVWTVAPRGATTITATADGETVRVETVLE